GYQPQIPKLDMDWGRGSPAKNIPSDYFSTFFQRNYNLNEGKYEIRVSGNDGVKVYINDNLVLDKWDNKGNGEWRETIALTKGIHRVTVMHYEGIKGIANLSFNIKPFKAKEYIYQDYDITLDDFADKQLTKSPQTDKYKKSPGWIHKDNLTFGSISTINGNGVRLRSDPNDSSAESIKYTVNFGTKVDILERGVQGFVSGGNSEWYRIRYKNNESLYVHSNLVNENADVANIRPRITGESVNLRSEPSLSSDANIEYTVKRNTRLDFIKNVQGTSVGGSTLWYEVMYKGKKLYVHSSLASFSTNYYAEANTNHSYGLTSKSPLNIIGNSGDWYKIDLSTTWRSPTKADLLKEIDPSKQDELQFLVLSESTGISSNQLNTLLKDKGNLAGKGKAYIKAGKKHGVNEIYLIAHSLLETGSGTNKESKLATGVEVGKDSDGVPQLVTKSNKKSLRDIKTVFNVYGIGAFDRCPLACGAREAYDRGWFTVEEAIIGGGNFVSNEYFDNGQTTLYSMRWNPANPGHHQYATDIGWARKQILRMKKLYSQLDNPPMKFNIVRFKD
ncbi:hypothetical protein FPQ10_11685, partial [Allobacillus sp. SKP2-8]|uniref:glucosaminidase domain-containing protein n=2 Tax=unclassified Allobacillus TaxID=2628859 RepID=UPI0011972D58